MRYRDRAARGQADEGGGLGWAQVQAQYLCGTLAPRPAKAKASYLADGLPCRTGDVGGQKTLRSYWRNYFEKTDALIWVVDATDRLRIGDCRDELHGLLLEEVRFTASGERRAVLTATWADSD